MVVNNLLNLNNCCIFFIIRIVIKIILSGYNFLFNKYSFIRFIRFLHIYIILLFYKSANRGDPESARYLGIMYLRGKGVQKDTQKALEWFTKAANGGDALARKNVKTLQILNSRM